MRILVLTAWYPPHHLGGYELSCRDVVERLRARGHEVEVLCSDERIGAEPVPAPGDVGVHRTLRVHARQAEPVTLGWRASLAIERHDRRALQAAIDAFRPDVVSVWQLPTLPVSLLDGIQRAGCVPVLVVCDDWMAYAHQLDGGSRRLHADPIRRILRRALGRAAGVALVADPLDDGAVLFISESTRARAHAAAPWRWRREAVVHSGVDLRTFREDPATTAGPERPWLGRVLFSGRFDPRKGIDALVRAMELLPGHHLVIAGKGGSVERARIVGLVDQLGLTARVRFVDVDRAGLAEEYQQADVVVFPSEWEEPFGLVPLEAMACGTPVVGTARGGTAEFLVDGWNALVVPPADPRAIALAVGRLAGDAALRSALREGGRASVADLDVETLTDRIEAWHLAAAERWAGGEPAGRAPRAVVEARTRSADPLARHRAATGAALAAGDAASVKQLYADLGADWLDATAAAGLDGVPVLSAPETRPVVVGALAERRGLVLDAGCGPNPAVAAALAADPGRRVVALDIGWGTVATARAVAGQAGATLLGVVGDVERLPFRGGAFAALVCDDTIEHLPDDATGAAELARVLAPGGTALIATPNRWSLSVLAAKLRDRWHGRRRLPSAYYAAESHLREYTWAELDRLLAPRFGPRRRHPVGWTGGRKRRLATRVVQLPVLWRLSQMIVVEAEPRR